MQVNIPCPCGQPYEFEVEPENGRMPVEVHCPACGASGTDQANAFIASHAPSVTPAVAQPQVRVVSRSVAAPTIPAEPNAAPSFERASAARVSPTRIVPGALGAAVAATIGMIAWYLLIKFTGYEIGYAAWGIGALTGVGARMLAGRGSHALAIAAGACAFVAIMGGQYLVARGQFDEALDTFLDQQYEKRMTFAREALKAESDDDLKTVLTKYATEEKQAPAANAITNEDVARFRTEEMPRLQRFVEGKPGRAEYTAAVRGQLNSVALRMNVLKQSVGIFTLLWLFLGVSSAYRIAARNE